MSQMTRRSALQAAALAAIAPGGFFVSARGAELDQIAESYRQYAAIGRAVSGRAGAVAGGNPRGVAAGLAILAHQGNAADAGAAVILAQTVVDYGLVCIGGEVPLISYRADRGKTRVFSGLGGAPRDPNAIQWFYENDIPHEGSIKATPVPGVVGLLFTTLEHEGTMSFEQIAQPTLAILQEGEEDWHARFSKTVQRLIEAEQRAAGDRVAKLKAGRDRFYKGDIADQLDSFFRREGGFLRKQDLADHVTHIEEPVGVDYHDYRVVKCDSWTQGPMLCQALKLLEGFDLEAMGHLSTDYIHVVTEALKLALADRDAHYGDPRFVDVPMQQLLSEQYAHIRRPLINLDRASRAFRPGDPVAMEAVRESGAPDSAPGGTTSCVVVDRWGNFVAATPSANGPYAVCEELGVAFGNRLRSFNTSPGHPNRIEPGKRPRITLTPTLVFKKGRPVMGMSVVGGDLQDQTTLNALLNHIHFGMKPAEALGALRFATGHHEGSFRPFPDRAEARIARARLTVQQGLDEAVREELTERGHDVRTTGGDLGRPSMILVDGEPGTMLAAGDARTDRYAGAL